MSERIIRNSIRCLGCLDEIESTHRHDFKFCSCGQVAVDGGKAYLRRLSSGADGYVETSLVEGP